MKKILKVVFVITGTIIGAGFASGKEIYLFFNVYGKIGQLGIILSSIITGAIIYITLNIAQKKNINNYMDLLENTNKNGKIINKLIYIIVNIFLLISFFIMTAGFSAFMNQMYKIDEYVSSTIFLIGCFIIFNKNINGIVKINEILIPLLILFIMYLGIKNIPYLITTNTDASSQMWKYSNKWILSSILYASYNSIILIPILINMKGYINGKNSIKNICIFSTLIISILAFSIYGLLLRGQFYVNELELPLIEISLEFGNVFRYIYAFIIIVSIFTSAISSGYSFLENVSKNKKSYTQILIIMCIISLFISKLGFSNLVKILYPIFGILGLIQIIILFVNNKKEKREYVLKKNNKTDIN